jgi:DNA-binding transcriptional LysR family regulator
MEDLNRMAIFAMVVEQRTMQAAARQLGMSASAVSQQIRVLERNLEVVLLHRSTRKLTLTDAGAQFYEGCAQMLAAARSAHSQLAELRDDLVGELRIAAPVGFAGPVLTEPLLPLLAAHPRLRLKLILHDEPIDLIEQRIDLAIRAGQFADSSFVARRLADWNMVLCAAPAYLARSAKIHSPDDLTNHEWLTLGPEQAAIFIDLTGPQDEHRKLRVESRVHSNSMVALREFTLAGAGLALLAEPEVQQMLAEGRLVRVLPEWKMPSFGVFAVTPKRDAQPAKVRQAIEAFRSFLTACPAKG